MQPKGDQPEAIKTLVKGINSKQRFQTLLGVTGSGKSVVSDTPVLVYLKDEMNQYVPVSIEIGFLIDELISKSNLVERDKNGTEILYAVDVQDKYFVPSFNPAINKTEIKPITAFVRHESPSKLYKVKTDCGRLATLTGDHNFFILRGGRMQLVETRNLRQTDYIPLPLGLEELVPQQGIDFIDLRKYTKVALYSSAKKSLEVCADVYGKKSVVTVMSNSYKSDAWTKFWNIRKDDERVDVCDLGPLFKNFPLMNTFDFGIKSRLGKEIYPMNYPVSNDFLKLVGVYLAEGWSNGKYVLLSIREKPFLRVVDELLKNLHLNYQVRPNGDIVVANVIFADLLKRLCGSGAFNKFLPVFWPRLSLKQLASLLSGYFSGDGGVDGMAVTATTASGKLASDLLYALNRFGIWARRRRVFKRAFNSATHEGDFYNCISISGQNDLHIFEREIGFIYERKNDSLKKIIDKKFNTNVDVVPGVGAIILAIRKDFNLRQKDLATWAGLSRSMISFIESENRSISRVACERLSRRLLKNFPNSELVKKLIFLLSSRWTPVKSVEEVIVGEKYVYDFSVKDNETFLAGDGGMFVHNTFTMAKVIENVQRPTLILAHNKTLAAQLCSEFKEFFPDNAVSYFVSYYDYYQPEAYMPATDTYIEKDASINEEIDKFRHAATTNLLTRKDVIIVASVSCIYGLGSVEDYNALAQTVTVGDNLVRDKFLRHLTDLQYVRSSMEFKNGMFHVLGDTIEIFPRDRDTVFRLEFFGDEIEAISEVDSFTGELINELNSVTIFPAKHDVTTQEKVERAVDGIRKDLDLRYNELKKMGRNLEAERIKTRTEYDIEILLETGYCNGIENYTRYLSGKEPGDRPTTLMDYMPDDFLLFIDESHMTVPQIGGMHNGNFSRKQTLIEHGFRLPSSHDNRPLKFDEFEDYMKNTVFVSATPGKYEYENTPKNNFVEQIVRPTGLVDPEISVRPSKGQIEDLLKEIKKRTDVGERVLITTLTKRSAEDLTEFLSDADIRVKYLHSDVETIERIEILRDLRLGKFDVLVGINLLREGLDLPEVSLVAILDADKEGFLRSASALIQTTGRCARNVNGSVIMYADKMTKAMEQAIGETDRRRKKQVEYNKKHGITPETIKKAVRDISQYGGKKKEGSGKRLDLKKIPKDEAKRLINSLEAKMDLASQNLEFEKAAELRDEIENLREEFGV